MTAHTEARPAPLGGRLVTKTTVLLALPIAAMAAVLVYRMIYGLGAVTNLSNGYPWGVWIAWDVTIGTALGGGGFATALLVYILNRGQYHPLIRPALLAALLGYLQAGLSVFVDLGRWWDFWHIFWPKYAQTNSALFEVAICVMAYTVILAIELMPAVLERLKWQQARRRLERVLFVFVAIGVLLPTMHQSSLGTLLVVFGPQVHPLYQSKLLPLLFLTSTIGMGYAAVTLEAAVSSQGLRRPFEKEILGKLLQIGRVVAALFLFARLADVLYRGALPYALTPSLPMAMFWLENLLFSVPLWLLAGKANAGRAKYIFLSAMAMALGGIVYRLSAFLIAYQTGAGWSYFPSLGELTVTVGLICFEALGIIVAVKLLPILPAELSRTSS